MIDKRAASNKKQIVQHRLLQICEETVPKKAWLSLGVIFFLFLCMMIWSFFGTVETTIDGKGIILRKDALFTTQTPVKGIVRELYVKPGDFVKKGALVATIADPQKELLLEANQIKKESLIQELNRLVGDIELEKEASNRFLITQANSLKFEIKILEEKLEFLDKEHLKKEGLFKEGLIIRNILQDSQRQISQSRIFLEEKKAAISEIESKLSQAYRSEDLKSKEFELLKALGEVQVIEHLVNQNKIYSEVEGRVLEVLVTLGEVVTEGEQLFNVELNSTSQPLLFYGFFPSEVAKNIHEGAIMRMALSTVNQNEYGVVLSRVIEVSNFAISQTAILNEIQNSDLFRLLSAQQPVIKVIAEPILDPSDPSTFAWTSKQGPPMELTQGLVGRVSVTVEKIHPIYYLIPLNSFKETSLGKSL